MPTGRTKSSARNGGLTGPVAKPVNNLEGAHRQFANPDTIKQHYWQRLKRVLGRRYGIDPLQVDSDFIESLKPIGDAVDLGTVVYLYSYKDKFPPMNNSELKQWVSVAIECADHHDINKSQFVIEVPDWT